MTSSHRLCLRMTIAWAGPNVVKNMLVSCSFHLYLTCVNHANIYILVFFVWDLFNSLQAGYSYMSIDRMLAYFYIILISKKDTSRIPPVSKLFPTTFRVWPGLNCSLKLSTDDTSRQRVTTR